MAENPNEIELQDGTKITIPTGAPDGTVVSFHITKWFETPDGIQRQFRANLDLFPEEARNFSRMLVARADVIDPPKTSYEHAVESRRVMMDPSITWDELVFGTVRPDWASIEHPGMYAVLWDKYADSEVEHRAYHPPGVLFPILEEDSGRIVFGTPLPDPGSEVAW